jgi:hypothetical protein
MIHGVFPEVFLRRAAGRANSVIIPETIIVKGFPLPAAYILR